jgi:N4-gp56 family major capsid protein
MPKENSMSNVNKYGDISPRNAGYAVKTLLKRAQEAVYLERFGSFDPQPKNNTNIRRWRRYLSLPPAMAPLAEGIPPAGQMMRHEDISCTLEQYGDLVWLTDVVQDTHEDPVLEQAMEVLGEQARDTAEFLRWAVVRAGSHVIRAGGVASRDLIATTITAKELKLANRAFKRAKAQPFSRLIAASHRISTMPVRASYWALAHTDLEADIRNITGFIDAEKYANPSSAVEGEIGAAHGFRFIVSSNFNGWEAAGAAGTTMLAYGVKPSTSTKCDVLPVVLVARNAYAIVPLQGKSAVNIAVRNPSPSVGDPMGQKGFASWKRWDGCVILNQSFLQRIECACTAEPT